MSRIERAAVAENPASLTWRCSDQVEVLREPN
jgi:hypothetical protein